MTRYDLAILGTDGTVGGPSGSPLSSTVISTATAPTGTASTDTANLQDAINGTGAGGLLLLPGGTYALNAALSVTQSMTIASLAAGPTFASRTAGGSTQYPESPYLAGTVLEQTVAATDIIDITGSAVSVNLSRLGLLFESGLASTGHGINATPSQTYGSGLDMGLADFSWDQVYVYGHDGNHYAIVLMNPQYGTINHLRSYGGGGILIEVDDGGINGGNLVFEHPYMAIFNNGSAVGIGHNAYGNSTPGSLNLITYVRPQVILSGSAEQEWYNDLLGSGTPVAINIIGADFEGSPSNNLTVGSGTQFIGQQFINAARWNATSGSITMPASAGAALSVSQGGITLIGASAGVAATTGAQNTAVGCNALSAVTTSSDNTAIGFAALQYNTNGDNTAIGSNALQGVSGSSSGEENTAVGFQSLTGLTTGNQNTAVGQNSLKAVTTGSTNTAVGFDAGQSNLTTASSCTFVGANTSTSANVSYATALGKGAAANAAGSMALGVDSSGNGATSSTSNVIALGTVNHTTVIAGTLVTSAAALATTGVSGFLYIPTCAGVPTGTPTAQTGTVPLVFDTTDSRLYIYTGGAWTDAFTA